MPVNAQNNGCHACKTLAKLLLNPKINVPNNGKQHTDASRALATEATIAPRCLISFAPLFQCPI